MSRQIRGDALIMLAGFKAMQALVKGMPTTEHIENGKQVITSKGKTKADQGEMLIQSFLSLAAVANELEIDVAQALLVWLDKP